MTDEDASTKTPRFHIKHAKTPVTLQMEAVECGAAALSIILGYYKSFIPLEELRVECGVSRDGSKASNVIKAARKYGLEAQGFRKDIEDLKDLPTPYIVFWNFNHFLVVEGFSGDKVYLNDPAGGQRTITMQEFDLAFTGVVLTFKPSETYKPQGKKPSILASLKKRFYGAKKALIFLIITGVCLAIPGILIPIFTKVFIDKYLIEGLKSWIAPLIIGMVITAIFRGGLTWLQEYFLIKLETKLSITLSSKFFWHVLHLPMTFFSQRSPGDVSTRIGLNDTVAQALSRRFMTTVISLILAIFYLVIMFYYNVTLTFIALFSATLTAGISEYFNRKRKDLSQSILVDASKFTAKSMDGLLAIETLKASGREDDFFSQWSGYQAKMTNGVQKNTLFTYTTSIIPVILSGLNTALILGLGSLHVMSGVMTIGMLVAFQSLTSSFLGPVNTLVSSSTAFNELFGSMVRLDDVHNHPTAKNVSIVTEEKERKAATQTPKLEGFLELKNISFGYSPLDPPLIEDFNLKLKPGHRVALVGSTGCGKSTVAKLVMGLNEPWSGEILFDGVPVNDIPRPSLTNSLAIVDQNIVLFEGTIRDNLTLWDTSIPEHTFIKAAKDACIHDDIMMRDKGYDAYVDEGGFNFSGGQRQRLEIARALCIMPRIIVMDEATSALDPITEVLVDQSIRLRGCTCLIVAHRLSTIRDCDEIIVLDKGKVMQRGTHDELYAQEGHYQNLIKAI